MAQRSSQGFWKRVRVNTRLIVRSLDKPAYRLPALRRASEGMGAPVAVLCGLSWGAFLAAYVASTGDGIRDVQLDRLGALAAFDHLGCNFGFARRRLAVVRRYWMRRLRCCGALRAHGDLR